MQPCTNPPRAAASCTTDYISNPLQVEKLADPVSPVAEILKRVPAKTLMGLYKIPAFKDADELLQHVAGARGKLRRGGTPDMRAAARILLQASRGLGHVVYCCVGCVCVANRYALCLGVTL